MEPMNHQQPNAMPEHQQGMTGIHTKNRTWIPWTILAIVIIAVLVVIGIVFRTKLFPVTAPADKLSGYQAVFLTNGQVYFGKISHVNSDYVQLMNIYYLQVNQPAGSSATAATDVNSSAANASTQLSLVKLGNELHGPADYMFINRDQILFYEDLKASGQVAQAIVKYQQSGGTAGAANSSPAQGTQQAPATGAPAASAPADGTSGSTASGAPVPTSTGTLSTPTPSK